MSKIGIEQSIVCYNLCHFKIKQTCNKEHVFKVINNASTKNLYFKAIVHYALSWIFINKVLVHVPSDDFFFSKKDVTIFDIPQVHQLYTQTLGMFCKA